MSAVSPILCVNLNHGHPIHTILISFYGHTTDMRVASASAENDRVRPLTTATIDSFSGMLKLATTQCGAGQWRFSHRGWVPADRLPRTARLPAGGPYRPVATGEGRPN